MADRVVIGDGQKVESERPRFGHKLRRRPFAVAVKGVALQVAAKPEERGGDGARSFVAKRLLLKVVF